jgi:nucleotide-binding universal stress UspA family protein
VTSDGEGQQVVVVGVDGSAESINALRWASRYATATGATVRAVHAWHYPTAASVPPVGLTPEPVESQVEQHVRDGLAESVAEVFPAEAGVESKVVYGHPAQVLIDESKDASLLVVGHRGHGAFTGMLVGSVSIHCVTHAACPVVVVR